MRNLRLGITFYHGFVIMTKFLQKALIALRPSSVADFTAMADDIQMGSIIQIGIKKVRQELMGAIGANFLADKSPSFAQSEDVGIDWKGRHSERELHHDRSGFLANTLEAHQPLTHILRWKKTKKVEVKTSSFL
jgi:hypothetical protein